MCRYVKGDWDEIARKLMCEAQQQVHVPRQNDTLIGLTTYERQNWAFHWRKIDRRGIYTDYCYQYWAVSGARGSNVRNCACMQCSENGMNRLVRRKMPLGSFAQGIWSPKPWHQISIRMKAYMVVCVLDLGKGETEPTKELSAQNGAIVFFVFPEKWCDSSRTQLSNWAMCNMNIGRCSDGRNNIFIYFVFPHAYSSSSVSWAKFERNRRSTNCREDEIRLFVFLGNGSECWYGICILFVCRRPLRNCCADDS